MKNYVINNETRNSLKGDIRITEWECGCKRVLSPYGNKFYRCENHPDKWPEINKKFMWYGCAPFEKPHRFDTYEMRRLRNLIPDAPEGDGNLIKAAISAGIKVNHLGAI